METKHNDHSRGSLTKSKLIGLSAFSKVRRDRGRGKPLSVGPGCAQNDKIGLLVAPLVLLLSGCNSNPVTGANVAYCEANPREGYCPGILKRAKEKGVSADPQALASLQEQSRSQDSAAVAQARFYSTRRIGRVVDVQVVSHGSPASNAGATLGSATAQASYIDNTLGGSGNYSAMGQVTAGVLGGIIGSALDQPAKSWYAVHYWIDFGGGPREVPVSSYAPTYAPRGTCVVAYQGKVSVTDDAECRN